MANLTNQKFAVGKTYYTRSIGDYDCIYKMTVLSRTEKTVKVNVHNFGEKTLRISTKYSSNEQVKPLGNYSMSPTVCSSDIFA